ncbi:DUF4238 domain-containing protein [Clostridioides difficile]|nr:DUF4238 domain-containing protein [Clostridioides difficile]
MKNKTTKNQHYVPQVYLESFINKKGHCYVYDKLDDKFFSSTPRNIMSIRYFYDFDLEKFKSYNEIYSKFYDKPILSKQVLEENLALIEGGYHEIINNINNDNFNWFSVNKLHYLDMYKYITIQFIRTPKGKKYLLELNKLFFKKDFSKEYENIFVLKELSDITKCEKNSVILEMFLEDYSHLSIGINKSDIPFITSDNPVMIIDKYNDKDEIVYYPITPTRCILLKKYNKVDSKYKEVLDDFARGKYKIQNSYDFENEIYRREKELNNRLNPLTIDLNNEEVKNFNLTCANTAERYLVSNEDFRDKHSKLLIFLNKKII